MSSIQISNSSWSLIYDFLQSCDNIYTSNEPKLRKFITAIFFVTRSGVQWRLLPEEHGKWYTVYHRFNDWTKKGVWEKMFRHFSADNDLEYIMIDASIMRAHACAAGAKKGAIKLSVEARAGTPPNCMHR